MNNILKQIKSDKEQAMAQQSLVMLKQQMESSLIKIKVIFYLMFKILYFKYHKNLIYFRLKKESARKK